MASMTDPIPTRDRVDLPPDELVGLPPAFAAAWEAPVGYLLVKLAARCNLGCTYCYWFRDADVYNRPSILSPEVEDAFLRALLRHLKRYNLGRFSLLFHGGEPMLFGWQRFRSLMEKLAEIEEQTGCRLHKLITTNGVLVNAQWASVFYDHEVQVTVSLDGPSAVHDQFRINAQGEPTHALAERGFRLLQSHGLQPGVLAVCAPNSNPKETVDYFVDHLGEKAFDILVPDATHEDAPVPSIARYYTELFDYVYFHRRPDALSVRFFRSILRGLLGRFSNSDSIGLSPVSTTTLLTDGSLEPLDVVHITGFGSTRTDISVLSNEIQDIKSIGLWRELFLAGARPCRICQECDYYYACGGGAVASRWSTSSRFANPSVYCDDYKKIIGHIWNAVGERIAVTSSAGVRDQ